MEVVVKKTLETQKLDDNIFEWLETEEHRSLLVCGFTMCLVIQQWDDLCKNYIIIKLKKKSTYETRLNLAWLTFWMTSH